MPGTVKSCKSIKCELIFKSREAALAAIKSYNDPLLTFKSETFIVLMIIAWTYLLHAHYREKKVEYRYFEQGPKRRRFKRTKRGAFLHWQLDTCLDAKECPLDAVTKTNLRFLIGLRHEIEHQMTRSLDNYLSARYQACAINFNTYVKRLFGARYAIDGYLTYSIQFVQLAEEQLQGAQPSAVIPDRLKAYIAEFDGALTHDEFNNDRYAYRLIFKQKLVGRSGQADRVVEFIDPKSEVAKTIDKEFWVQKEVEKPKFRAKEVATKVRDAGFTKFRVQPEHVNMWKSEKAKEPGKGYGVQISGEWFWYDKWVEKCIELCTAAGDRYR